MERTQHWSHLIRKRRRRALGISTKQMAAGQVVSLVGSVAAGVLLEQNKYTLAAVAGAFVLLPGVFDISGSLGATLSAKINHQLEDARAKPLRVFLSNVIYVLCIAAVAGLLVAGFGATVAHYLFGADFWQVFALGELAIIICSLIGYPFIGGLSLLFRKLSINPDDVVGPIESSVFDILTVLSMVIVIGWLL